MLSRFNHFMAPTLPHLLALLLRPTSDFPSEKTSLIVIDSISTIFNLAFPRAIEDASNKIESRVVPQQHFKRRNETVQWASNRRWAVMSDFLAKLRALATIKNIAILIVNQTVARIRPDKGAVLLPGLSSNAWENGIPNRVLLYRDWISGRHNSSYFPSRSLTAKESRHVRFAAVCKVAGASLSHHHRVELPKAVPLLIGQVK